jgi:predicted nucleic acid-binding protein
MTKYVIGPDVALRLAQEETAIAGGLKLLAPTLIRSQLLAMLYRAVRQGQMTRKDAEHHLNYVRGLRIRLLGDRVLQNVAWRVADQLGWPDTFEAEYIALTQLQADAFITLNADLAAAVRDLVALAPFDVLSRSKTS